MLRYKNEFMEFIKEVQPQAFEFNPSSTQQLQQLIYAPFKRKIDKNVSSKKNIDNLQKDNNELESIEEDTDEDPMKITRVFTEINDFPKTRYFKLAKIPDFEYPEYLTNPEERKLKYRQMPIEGFGIKSSKYSISGLPSVDTDALKKLVEGPIEEHFQ